MLITPRSRVRTLYCKAKLSIVLRLVACNPVAAEAPAFTAARYGSSSLQVHIPGTRCSTHSFKLCSCVLFNYVSKLPRGNLTTSKWQWVPKHVDCDIRNRIREVCWSAKHADSSNKFLRSKRNLQYCSTHFHWIICTALARLELWRRQLFHLFRDLLFTGVLTNKFRVRTWLQTKHLIFKK